jgi:hypothetical protein
MWSQCTIYYPTAGGSAFLSLLLDSTTLTFIGKESDTRLAAVYENYKHYDAASNVHTSIRNIYSNAYKLFVINIIGTVNVHRQLVKFRKHSHVS